MVIDFKFIWQIPVDYVTHFWHSLLSSNRSLCITLMAFSNTFGLACSPPNSAELRCSSKVTQDSYLVSEDLEGNLWSSGLVLARVPWVPGSARLAPAKTLNITSGTEDFEVLNTNWHPQSSYYVTSSTPSFKFLTQALIFLAPLLFVISIKIKLSHMTCGT